MKTAANGGKERVWPLWPFAAVALAVFCYYSFMEYRPVWNRELILLERRFGSIGLALLAARYAGARLWNERGRGWIFYVACTGLLPFAIHAWVHKPR